MQQLATWASEPAKPHESDDQAGQETTVQKLQGLATQPQGCSVLQKPRAICCHDDYMSAIPSKSYSSGVIVLLLGSKIRLTSSLSSKGSHILFSISSTSSNDNINSYD